MSYLSEENLMKVNLPAWPRESSSWYMIIRGVDNGARGEVSCEAVGTPSASNLCPEILLDILASPVSRHGTIH